MKTMHIIPRTEDCSAFVKKNKERKIVVMGKDCKIEDKNKN